MKNPFKLFGLENYKSTSNSRTMTTLLSIILSLMTKLMVMGRMRALKMQVLIVIRKSGIQTYMATDEMEMIEMVLIVKVRNVE